MQTTDDVELEAGFDDLNLSPRRNIRSKVRRSLFSESTDHHPAAVSSSSDGAPAPSTTRTSWDEASAVSFQTLSGLLWSQAAHPPVLPNTQQYTLHQCSCMYSIPLREYAFLLDPLEVATIP